MQCTRNITPNYFSEICLDFPRSPYNKKIEIKGTVVTQNQVKQISDSTYEIFKTFFGKAISHENYRRIENLKYLRKW